MARPSIFLDRMVLLLLTPMARPSIAMALRLFFSFGLSMDTTLIPLPSGFLWDTGFDFSIRFSVEKAGLILAFVAQMMDGPAWKEDWFGAFGVKAV
jgi:hypothetical protein